MKTLIAAAALSLAIAAPALAQPSDAGVGSVLQPGYNVSGSGVVGAFRAAKSEPRTYGRPSVLRKDNDVTAFGFRAVSDPRPARLDPSEAGIPAVLQ